jgi:hypothetical protein
MCPAGLKFLVDDATLNVQPVRLNETLQRGPGSEQESSGAEAGKTVRFW